MSDELARLFADSGPLSGVVPGYAHRPEQFDLARSVLDALEGGRRLLVEAPCGSGKTLGYVVPSLLHASRTGCRVVVATSTIPLETQLFEGEVALSLRLFPGARAVKLLGRANYLCLKRAHEALSDGALPAATVDLLDECRIRGGEFEAAGAADPEATDLHCDYEFCEGSRCAFFADCFYFRRRREARGAGIVIMNHALLLAESISSRDGGAEDLLEGAAVIFDEAHRLPDTLTASGSETLDPPAFYRALHALERAGLRIAGAGDAAGERIAQRAREAAALVPPLFPKTPRGKTPGHPRALAGARDLARFSTPEAANLEAALRELSALSDAQTAAFDLSRGAEWCRKLAGRLERFRHLPADAFLWVDRDAGPAYHLAPYKVDRLFRELVAERAAALVLVSGTLSLQGNFDFFKTALDLRDSVDLSFSADFERGLDRVLYIAEDLPSPKEGGFYAALVARIEEILHAVPGKSLVLFTSLSLLRSAASDLRVPFLTGGIPLLVQGEAGRGELLRRFRREPGGALFASVSFWEGVDVREHPIRNLVLTRLPFQPPDDPVISARSDRLKSEGGEPFRDLFIPAAALKIKQGVGRLTRDRAEWGVVSVLDSRLRTERYGRLLMPAFGDMKVVTGLDDLRAFAAERA